MALFANLNSVVDHFGHSKVGSELRNMSRIGFKVRISVMSNIGLRLHRKLGTEVICSPFITPL